MFLCSTLGKGKIKFYVLQAFKNITKQISSLTLNGILDAFMSFNKFITVLVLAAFGCILATTTTPTHGCCPAYKLSAKNVNLEPFASFAG